MKTNWIVVGAVAALVSTTGSGAFANTAKAPAPTPIAANMMTNYTMEMSDMDSSATPDYSLLSDPMFNYTQIKAARASGLSFSQVASVLRISRLAGVPFSETMQKIQAGKTFPEIAYEDNLKLSDVYNVDNEKQQIGSYMAAYRTTGAYTLYHGHMDMDNGS